MSRYIVYFLISLGATTAGALTGMGGGVIIKPLLDLLGDLSAADIGVLSSVTVFSMALVSISKQIRQNTAIDWKIAVPLVVGSIFGGGVGDRILMVVLAAVRSNHLVVVIQNICLAFLVAAVFIYLGKGDNRPVLGVRGVMPAILVGVFLGIASSFLGIGGGPINVALIIFVFACDIKTAAVYSLVTILSAQVSKLSSVLLSGNFFSYDLSMLPVMVFGAIAGGWIGSKLNKTFTEKTVVRAFKGMQILVFAICLYNILNNLF